MIHCACLASKALNLAVVYMAANCSFLSWSGPPPSVDQKVIVMLREFFRKRPTLESIREAGILQSELLSLIIAICPYRFGRGALKVSNLPPLPVITGFYESHRRLDAIRMLVSVLVCELMFVLSEVGHFLVTTSFRSEGRRGVGALDAKTPHALQMLLTITTDIIFRRGFDYLILLYRQIAHSSAS